MSDLILFQKVLREFQHRTEDLKHDYDERIADLPSIYAESYISTQKQIESEMLSDEMATLKEDFKRRVLTAKNILVGNESVKDGSFIDYKLLEKLNVLALANVELTKDEYLSMIADCLSSGSDICTRKLKALIKERNSESITFPSSGDAITLIESVAGRIDEAIEKFDILADASQNYGSYFANKRILDGEWLTKENEKYHQLTTSDIKGLRSSELKEKLLSKIDVSKIEKKESSAAKFAQEYSARMNPKRNSAFLLADEED